MNKTETRARDWLILEGGYSIDDVIFQRQTSPDFLTPDGKGWEVKLARRGQVVFTESQLVALRVHGAVQVLFWANAEEEKPEAQAVFSDLEIPGYWQGYRLSVMQMKLIQVGEEVCQRLQAYADGRPLGKAIERLLDGAVQVVPHQVINFTPPPEPKALAPPLDATGPPLDSSKGKASWTHVTQGRNVGGTEGVPLEAGPREHSLCTCGPGEKAKGKHSKWCPMRGK